MQTAQRKIQYEARPAAAPAKRVVKMDGNVAYISNGFAKQQVRQPAAAPKKAEKHKTGFVSTLCVIFVAFCAMAVLVSRYAAVCSVGAENNKLAQDIEAIETKVEALEVELELKDDLQTVQETARQTLKMQYPAQDQKIQMDMEG